MFLFCSSITFLTFSTSSCSSLSPFKIIVLKSCLEDLPSGLYWGHFLFIYFFSWIGSYFAGSLFALWFFCQYLDIWIWPCGNSGNQVLPLPRLCCFCVLLVLFPVHVGGCLCAEDQPAVECKVFSGSDLEPVPGHVWSLWISPWMSLHLNVLVFNM